MRHNSKILFFMVNNNSSIMVTTVPVDGVIRTTDDSNFFKVYFRGTPRKPFYLVINGAVFRYTVDDCQEFTIYEKHNLSFSDLLCFYNYKMPFTVAYVEF